MGMIRNPKVQGMIRGQRAAVGRMFPKFAERMKPVWDRMDELYGMKSGTAGGTAGGAAGGAAGSAASGPLSNNDPRSLTDPRTRSTVSKTLLGQ